MKVYDKNMFPSQNSLFLQEKVAEFAKFIDMADLNFLRIHMLFFYAKNQTSLKIGWGTFAPSTNVFNETFFCLFDESGQMTQNDKPKKTGWEEAQPHPFWLCFPRYILFMLFTIRMEILSSLFFI